jgi:hypothetical protein
MMDVSDDSPTPSPKELTPRRESIVKSEVTNNIDPALSGVSSPSDSGESARDRAEEVWIENIRLIEALRKCISDRLERKEYEDDDVSMGGTGSEKEAEVKDEKTLTQSAGLYPTLRADDD